MSIEQSRKIRSDKITLTTGQIREVERMAGMGLNLQQISNIIGISDRTLRRLRQGNEVLSAAISRGQAMATLSVATALYNKGLEGHVGAAKFWLSRRGGDEWREKPKLVEVFKTESSPSHIKLQALAAKVERMTEEEIRQQVKRLRALSEEE